MTDIDIKLERLLIAHELAVRLEVDLGYVVKGTAAWRRQNERAARAREKFEARLAAFRLKLTHGE